MAIPASSCFFCWYFCGLSILDPILSKCVIVCQARYTANGYLPETNYSYLKQTVFSKKVCSKVSHGNFSKLLSHLHRWLPTQHRKSHHICSIKKDVLKKLATFTEKPLCWSLFLIRLKRDFYVGVFLSEYCEIFKKTCFANGCFWHHQHHSLRPSDQ